MEAAVRPVANPSDIAVLHRIEVDVIDVTLEVRIISNSVLPEPPLPDSRFAPPDLAPRPQLRRRQLAGESAFDLAPASREIGISRRQGPNGVEMVRQDADGIRCERQAHLNRTINFPQGLDMLDKQLARSVKERNGEEEYPAFEPWAPISRHQRIVAREPHRVRKIALDAVPGCHASQAILHTLRSFGVSSKWVTSRSPSTRASRECRALPLPASGRAAGRAGPSG
jgi:hypothetical protein